uniref:SFRICE_025666 n=1 Tax=Spodoptera frugiperda TaxID=7108 RepID=A0A2H1W6F1_SPOFR
MKRCAMLRCCGYVWLLPVIFIGILSLALVADSATLFLIWKDECYACMRARDSLDGASGANKTTDGMPAVLWRELCVVFAPFQIPNDYSDCDIKAVT